jgi:hypothetical protein
MDQNIYFLVQLLREVEMASKVLLKIMNAFSLMVVVLLSVHVPSRKSVLASGSGNALAIKSLYGSDWIDRLPSPYNNGFDWIERHPISPTQ